MSIVMLFKFFPFFFFSKDNLGIAHSTVCQQISLGRRSQIWPSQPNRNLSQAWGA